MLIGMPAVEWTPRILFAAGEQGGWYDPSDISTLWQDNARTTPVTAIGQTVGAIDDKSGRGNHLLQATSSLRPAYQQDASGRFFLDPDGSGDTMASAAFNAGTDAMQFWLGADKPASALSFPDRTIFRTGAAGTNYRAFAQFSNATDGNVRIVSTGSISASLPITGTLLNAGKCVFFGQTEISSPLMEGYDGLTNVGSSTASQGTAGNYSATSAIELFVGNGNFKFYGMIIRFVSTTAAVAGPQTQAARWMARKTGVAF